MPLSALPDLLLKLAPPLGIKGTLLGQAEDTKAVERAVSNHIVKLEIEGTVEEGVDHSKLPSEAGEVSFHRLLLGLAQFEFDQQDVSLDNPRVIAVEAAIALVVGPLVAEQESRVENMSQRPVPVVPVDPATIVAPKEQAKQL